MTKPSATQNKPRKQHTPAFRDEALKVAQRIGEPQPRVNSVSTNLNFIPGVASNSRACPHPNVSRNLRPKMPSSSANWPKSGGADVFLDCFIV